MKKGLIRNMKDFIPEVGKDFTFIDEEYRVQVGGSDYQIGQFKSARKTASGWQSTKSKNERNTGLWIIWPFSDH